MRRVLLDQCLDERPGSVCLADRNAVKPNDFSVVVFKFWIVPKPLAETRRILFSPQQKQRRHQQHREGVEEAVESKHCPKSKVQRPRSNNITLDVGLWTLDYVI